MKKPAKNTVCLWYEGDAEDAARFYAATFPNSSVGTVYHAPGDYPSGKKGDVLMVCLHDVHSIQHERFGNQLSILQMEPKCYERDNRQI